MLPRSWTSAPLEELVSILDSKRVPLNAVERDWRTAGKAPEFLFPYFGATGQAGWIDDFLFDEPLILLGEDGVPFLDRSRAKAYLVEGKCWVNNHAHVLRATDAIVDRRILAAFLNAFDYQGRVTGSTRLKLTQEAMRRIPIPLAPRAEQKRIADKLDSLLAHVDACRQRLDRVPAILKRFRQSVLAAATTGELTREWREERGAAAEWESVPLGELIADGPKNGLYKPSTAYGAGTRILRIDNFYDGFTRPWEELKRLQVSPRERSDYGLAVGDILVNRVNSLPYLGKSALIRDLPEETVFESNMMRLRVDPGRVLPEFAILALTSPAGTSQLRRGAKHAVNQASINQTDVRGVEVPLPALSEQAEVVLRVGALMAQFGLLDHRYTKCIEAVAALPGSALGKAFRGELVPQDPSDEPASAMLERFRAQNAVAVSEKKPKPSRRAPSRPKPTARPTRSATKRRRAS